MPILSKWKLWLMAVTVLVITLTTAAYFSDLSQTPGQILDRLGQQATNIDLATMVAQAFPWGGDGGRPGRGAGGLLHPPISPLPKIPKDGGPYSPLSPLPTPSGMTFPPGPAKGNLGDAP